LQKIPVFRLNFPRLSAREIFRKYPSQTWYIWICGKLSGWFHGWWDKLNYYSVFSLGFYIKYLVCILLKISSCCQWQLSKHNEVLDLRLKCPIRGAVKTQLHIKNRSISWLWYCILKMPGKYLCNKLRNLSYVQ